MADNTIDSLVLEISSNSQGAEKALDKLADSLLRLQKGLGNVRGFGEVYSGLKKLGGATKAIDVAKLNGCATSLVNVTNAVTGLAKYGKQVNSVVNTLNKLSALDLTRLQIKGDFSGFSGLAKGASDFAEASLKLSGIKTTEINRTVKVLQKLGNVNLAGLAQSMDALKNTDMTALSNLGVAFQGLSASLANSEKISAGTAKLFSSLAQLSASAGNIAIIQQHLPALSNEIHKFVSTMTTAPSVQNGTTSLVTALSGLSAAGNRIQKTVAALPGLTSGVMAFVTALSSAPALNDNIVKAVESLSRIAPVGAKAGTAAKSLQKNIQSLSGTMNGLGNSSHTAIRGVKLFGNQLLSAVGIAGGIYGIIAGIKNAINYSSDLTEAQNVVNQGFGNLAYMADEFAQNAIYAFGMSELSAKKMSGQFAAMGRSLGVIPEKAAEMALSLTGLAGDLASFWNVSHDVAQTALESVFTGETESLKRFATVMTQANLQQFAYSKGVNKTVSAMNQAEMAQLRYAYVMEATAAAHGDFSRTSAGWAGQVRILAGQFRNLAGIIGGGLKAAFLPIITVINTVMAKIISLANLIASFARKIFKLDAPEISAGAGLSSMAEAAGGVADNMGAAAGGISDVGSAAKKAKKELNGFIAPWHEVNNMTSNDTAGGGGSGGGGASLPDMFIPEKYEFTVEAEDQASPVLDQIISRVKNLAELFKEGFQIGLGDSSVFESITQNILSIKKSLLDIATDSAVVNSFNNMLDTLAYNLGVKAGAFTSVGATIIDNITGGASIYLEEAKSRIKEYLVSMFDIQGDTDTIVTNFTNAVSGIFTVFRTPEAIQITSDIIQIFSDGFMGVSLLAAKIGRDILGLILNPITDNADGFKEAISNTLGPLGEVLGTLADSFTMVWTEINQMYDKHISPLFSSLTGGISEIIKTLLAGYNNSIAPVLDKLSERFSEVWQGTIEPLLRNFIGLFGDVADLVKTVWENILQPVVNWIAENIFPAIAPVLDNMGTKFLNTFEEIGKLFDGFVTTARGVVTFITGVFAGDWSTAWEGIKTAFKGIWDLMPDVVKSPIRSIISFINSMIGAVEKGINGIISALNHVSIDIPETPFSDALKIGFDLNSVSLPRIPQLSKGGILKKGQVGLLEGDGTEAVVPLEKNTQWISRVAENMSKEFGRYKVNAYVPKPDFSMSSYNMDKLRTTMQMEMDAKMATQQYEIRRQNQLLEKLINIVEQKDLHIGDDDIFNSARRGQHNFQRRTFRTGWAGID